MLAVTMYYHRWIEDQVGVPGSIIDPIIVCDATFFTPWASPGELDLMLYMYDGVSSFCTIFKFLHFCLTYHWLLEVLVYF